MGTGTGTIWYDLENRRRSEGLCMMDLLLQSHPRVLKSARYLCDFAAAATTTIGSFVLNWHFGILILAWLFTVLLRQRL